MADYSQVSIPDPKIIQLLDNYFDVMHHQDMEIFDRVFHQNCTLYSAQQGFST
jgi:hypothetical protein